MSVVRRTAAAPHATRSAAPQRCRHRRHRHQLGPKSLARLRSSSSSSPHACSCSAPAPGPAPARGCCCCGGSQSIDPVVTCAPPPLRGGTRPLGPPMPSPTVMCAPRMAASAAPNVCAPLGPRMPPNRAAPPPALPWPPPPPGGVREGLTALSGAAQLPDSSSSTSTRGRSGGCHMCVAAPVSLCERSIPVCMPASPDGAE
mmetsp:Transcript_4617/g.13898  ORF Transcript_4617/g.13898 Transcript_4617/m.13898 type:complete len:201 (-) Transcript_4617:123-725(-)|eukprot:350984-Chlamydomonas_euryale.AAC.8